MSSFEAKGQWIDGQDVSLVWRLAHDDGALVQTNGAGVDVVSWQVFVYDLNSVSPETSIWTSSLFSNPAANTAPWWNTLQVDGYAFDAVGYNFRYRLLRSNLPEALGGHTLRVEIHVDCGSTLGARKMVWLLDVIPMLSQA